MSSEIDSVSEEYQSYALLVAAVNKDEQMLRYLWQCLGGFLWTERHFEPLMRALVELQWPAGIQAILQAEMTHDLIRALSSEERAFFIENMIGDLFSMSPLPSDSSLNPVVAEQDSSISSNAQHSALIAATLKEELTRQPYAGLFVLYMIDHFEDMEEEDFKYWDRCTQMTDDTSIAGVKDSDQDKSRYFGRNSEVEETKKDAIIEDEVISHQALYGVYKTELILLSKSNQSRFSQFILDFGLNRKDDRLRQEAMKFIECLRNLPEYAPLIEEGSEEAIMNGDEEVKFMKMDLQQVKKMLEVTPLLPSSHLFDLIKFTITGNLKHLQKEITVSSFLQDEHSLHLLILNTRGLAVKAYDSSRENTLINTREWNPVHYAIYFQQYKLLKMLGNELLNAAAQGGLSADIKAAIGYSHTIDEFKPDISFDEIIGTSI